MADLLALDPPTKDPGAFEAHYRSTRPPLVRRIPAEDRVEISNGPVMTPDGEARCYSQGLLNFVAMAELQAGIASPEGQADAADLADFARAGVSLLFFEEREP